jgi:hypothetical protein
MHMTELEITITSLVLYTLVLYISSQLYLYQQQIIFGLNVILD